MTTTHKKLQIVGSINNNSLHGGADDTVSLALALVWARRSHQHKASACLPDSSLYHRACVVATLTRLNIADMSE